MRLLIDHEVAPHFLHFNSSKVERLLYDFVMCCSLDVDPRTALSSSIDLFLRRADKLLRMEAEVVHRYV